MSSRASSVTRALLLVALASLMGCSLSYCGDEPFWRERELRYGEIAGTALVPGDAQEPAAFVQASVRGSTFVRQTNSEGRFVFAGLTEGPWMVTIHEDLDGDGKPERQRVVSAVLREASHRTSPSYIPFVTNEGEMRLAGVDLGAVVLEGTARVEGRVLLDGVGGEQPPVARGHVGVVVAGRNLDLPRLTSSGTDLVSSGVEAKTGIDDQGRFVLRNVSGGDIFLLVLLYEQGPSPGVPGALVHVSPPIAVKAKGGATTAIGDAIVLGEDLSTPRRSGQFVFSPPPAPSEQVYLTFVPPGRAMPTCEAAPIDYSSTPYPYALTSAQVPAGTTHFFNDMPVGVWDIQACFTSSPPATLFAQTVAPETEDEESVLLGPLLLSVIETCKPTRSCQVDADCGDGFTCDEDTNRCMAPDEEWRDCDGDGVRGLPPIQSDEHRDLWAACVSACFASSGEAVADLTCDAPDGNTYDCDDDGDGQPDVTEAQACYGIGRGTDSDGDGICDGVDPFPECRANTAEACEAGAEPDTPTVPEEYGGVEAGGAQCLVTRAAPEPEETLWCSAEAVPDADETCAVAAMRCTFTPRDGALPLCDAASGFGCPSGMACAADLGANAAGMAPCVDLSTEGCPESCPDGFLCGEAQVGGDPFLGCIADLRAEPSVYGEYSCDCCPTPGECRPGPTGFDTHWSSSVCAAEEMQALWDRCHGPGSVDVLPDAGPPAPDESSPDGGPDGGPDSLPDAGGSSGDDCVEIDATNGLPPPETLAECVVLAGGALSIVAGFDNVVNLGVVRTLYGNVAIQDNSSLTTIFAPSLEVVHGSFIIDNNPALFQLDLGSLQSVTDMFGVWRNPQLVVPPSVASISAEDGPRVSANGCVDVSDCTPFGLELCGNVVDFSETVCVACQNDDQCLGGQTCDDEYFGPSTGTYTCLPTPP